MKFDSWIILVVKNHNTSEDMCKTIHYHFRVIDNKIFTHYNYIIIADEDYTIKRIFLAKLPFCLLGPMGLFFVHAYICFWHQWPKQCWCAVKQQTNKQHCFFVLTKLTARCQCDLNGDVVRLTLNSRWVRDMANWYNCVNAANCDSITSIYWRLVVFRFCARSSYIAICDTRMSSAFTVISKMITSFTWSSRTAVRRSVNQSLVLWRAERSETRNLYIEASALSSEYL